MMLSPAFSSSTRAVAVLLLLLAALASGCAAVRNPALESARDAYQKAQQDPLIVRHAAAALDRAREILQEADRLWIEQNDGAEAEHLAYIVEKRIEIARVTAQRRLAASDIRQWRPPQP
jgi:hypothetical protein